MYRGCVCRPSHFLLMTLLCTLSCAPRATAVPASAVSWGDLLVAVDPCDSRGTSLLHLFGDDPGDEPELGYISCEDHGRPEEVRLLLRYFRREGVVGVCPTQKLVGFFVYHCDRVQLLQTAAGVVSTPYRPSASITARTSGARCS